ncbi:MAG TPA: glycosyltransferase [Candidatus Limnocylindrales bacterium]|nr:glycosyltransferase [Candidatus Limnocylindrales bacterium]
MTRPRLLRVITRLNVGGPATHVVLANRGLEGRGWETLLLYGEVEPDEAEIDVTAISTPSRRIPGLARPIRPAADLRAAVAVAGAIRRFRPHVVHTHLAKAGQLGRGTALLTSRAVRVHTFHGTLFGGYFGARSSRAIVLAERLLGHRTDAVLALSERQRTELIDHRIAPPDRIRIVPLGLDLDRFAPAQAAGARSAARARLGIDADAIVIAAIGRLVPIKRLERLVDAFGVVAAGEPLLRLYFVGGGSERAALEARVAASGLVGRVTFAGWSAATPDWYAAADVVALTSDREGTPLALIEAAAAGRPVVATDVGGVADVVAEGSTGFVVPADDGAALANRLARLVRDPELRASMGRAAPGRAERYRGERLVDDLDGLYRDLLQSRQREP